MSRYGCPECGCQEFEIAGKIALNDLFALCEGEAVENSPECKKVCIYCANEFTEPKEIADACHCGSERFTDRLVGDETITTCAECGREKNE